MILYTLWATRTYSEREGLAPELIEAWDEFSVDENAVGFDQACDKAVESLGTDLLEYRLIKIAVPEGSIRSAFHSTVTVGEVVQ